MEKVILVEPEIPENTGFIARLASNFEADLRIVNPQFNLSGARETANKSQDKIREAKIFNSLKEAVTDLDCVVGTKPERGIALDEFEPRKNVSLVFGRESSGLSNSELDLCDAVVHIKTGEYSSINLSHAASIIMQKCFVSEENEANVNMLDTLDDAVGDKTLELLKRASPTEKEAEAAVAEIRSRH